MKNIIKVILISLSILLVIYLIPIYTLFDEFKTPDYEVGTQSHEYGQAVNRIITSNIDENLKTDFKTILNIGSQEGRHRIIKLLNISAYYVIIISISILIVGVYLLKKNVKVPGYSLTICGLISPFILILSGYVTYISYLNY